eukprot:scaffold1795_cov92-Skeletonema_dohrnii-CCMP3373.AAC.5
MHMKVAIISAWCGCACDELGVNGTYVYVYVCVIADNRTALVGPTWKEARGKNDSVIACEDSTEKIHIKLQLLNILNIDLGRFACLWLLLNSEANDVIARARVPQGYLGCVYKYKVVVYWACCEEQCAACNEIVSSTHGSICRRVSMSVWCAVVCIAIIVDKEEVKYFRMTSYCPSRHYL